MYSIAELNSECKQIADAFSLGAKRNHAELNSYCVSNPQPNKRSNSSPSSSLKRSSVMPLFVILSLLLHILLLSAAHSQQTSTYIIGQVAQRDTNRPVYQLHLPPPPSTHPLIPEPLYRNVTTMTLTTPRNQRMRCVVPLPDPISMSRPVTDNPFDDIDELLSVYKGTCFFHKESWWTYEFCYGKHIVQKHVVVKEHKTSPHEAEEQYVLGVYDRHVDLQRRLNVSKVSTPDAAFTQLYTNGTVCDITNKPRQTIVKYLCSLDAVQLGGTSKKTSQSTLNILNVVREVASCTYEIHFINAAICQHATYREKAARAARIIHCSMHDSTPFEGLTPDKYNPTTLNM